MQFKIHKVAAVGIGAVVVGVGVIAVIGPDWSGAADPVKTFYTSPDGPPYNKWHLDAPGVPEVYRQTSESPHIYYLDTGDGYRRSVYCIDVSNHLFSGGPIPGSKPEKPLTDEQQTLLRLVIAQGPQNVSLQSLDFLKSYSATQLVVWLITEGDHRNASVIDSILFPATGEPDPATAYAQTVEIGRLGRNYLNFALAQLNQGNIELKPSFVGTEKDNAPLYQMSASSSGDYSLELADQANQLGANFVGGRLQVVDDAGLTITTTGNTMTISGKPSGTVWIEMEGKLNDGKVEYLIDPPNQEMARLIYSQPTVFTYWFGVYIDQPTEPPGTTPSPTQEPSPSLSRTISPTPSGSYAASSSPTVKPSNSANPAPTWSTSGSAKATITVSSSASLSPQPSVTSSQPAGLVPSQSWSNGGGSNSNLPNQPAKPIDGDNRATGQLVHTGTSFALPVVILSAAIALLLGGSLLMLRRRLKR